MKGACGTVHLSAEGRDCGGGVAVPSGTDRDPVSPGSIDLPLGIVKSTHESEVDIHECFVIHKIVKYEKRRRLFEKKTEIIDD